MTEADVISRGVEIEAEGVENGAPELVVMTVGKLALLSPEQVAERLTTSVLDSSTLEIVENWCSQEPPDYPCNWSQRNASPKLDISL